MSEELQRVMELIGARNDSLTPAQREANINRAWHILSALRRVVEECGSHPETDLELAGKGGMK